MTDERAVLVERRGRVGIATLNRPSKLNAMNTQLMQELEAAIQAFDADDDIGAIVLTGAGERAFSAGGDMKEQREQIEAGTVGQRRSASMTVRNARKPVIAAIRGYAFGGGALLAINCDIRIIGTDAKFKFHAAGYGQVAGGAILPRIVGVSKAKEILYTGDEIGAEEAMRLGLANRMVPPEEVLETAMEMATKIANNSPRAIAALQEIIDLALPWQEAQALEDRMNREIRGSSDSATRFKAAAAKVVGAP